MNVVDLKKKPESEASVWLPVAGWQEVKVRKLHTFRDQRGAFASLREISGTQEINLSYNKPHVLRGMHIQHGSPQSKLLTVVAGQILDAWVDLRPDSPTFGQAGYTYLDPGEVLMIPAGFGHGFLTLCSTIVLYAVDGAYNPATQGGVRFDSIGVPWPRGDYIVSEKDLALPLLRDYKSPVL